MGNGVNINLFATKAAPISGLVRSDRNALHLYSTPLPFMKDVIDHWLQSYNWRTFEAKLNAFPQFMCALEDHEGIDVHFIYQKAIGPARKGVPILLLQGESGCFYFIFLYGIK